MYDRNSVKKYGSELSTRGRAARTLAVVMRIGDRINLLVLSDREESACLIPQVGERISDALDVLNSSGLFHFCLTKTELCECFFSCYSRPSLLVYHTTKSTVILFFLLTFPTA